MKKKRTYQEVALKWLEDKRPYVKQSTFGIYCLHLEKHILPVFGQWQEIADADIQRWVNGKLEQGLSPKSMKDILLVLKMSLRYGRKNGMFPAPPLEIRFPTPRYSKRISVLTVEQQRRLWAYLRKKPTAFNLGVALCLHTGLRIGEVCALTWADLDLREGLVHVHKTLQRLYVVEPQHRGSCLLLDSPKTAESNREVPISHELLALLRAWDPPQDNAAYLLTGNGTPMEPRCCRRRFKHLLEQLNLPPIRFHGLRHSFATRCIESACDVKTVSVLLGHANIGTTLNYYVHPDLIQKKKAVEQMSRYIG